MAVDVAPVKKKRDQRKPVDEQLIYLYVSGGWGNEVLPPLRRHERREIVETLAKRGMTDEQIAERIKGDSSRVAQIRVSAGIPSNVRPKETGRADVQ